MNNTTQSRSIGLEQPCSLTLKLRYLKILAVTVVSLSTYFGNILILVTLRKFSSSFKGNIYMIIANLAAADLLLALGLTLQLAEFVFPELESERNLCLLKTCCIAVSVTCSSDMLSYMSLDRFCAIMFPIKHMINMPRKKRKRILLALTWVFSITVGCVPIFVAVISNSSQHLNEFSCKYGFMVPYKASFIVAIFIPLEFVFNICLCLVVVWRVLTNKVAKHKYKNSMIKCVLTVQIYIVFAICWAPYVVTTFLMETNKNDRKKYFCLREYTVILGFLNSGINWLVYGLGNKKFRKHFKRILTCEHGHTASISQLRPQSYDISKVRDT